MYHKRTFPYPDESGGMFKFENLYNEVLSATNSYTTLRILINKPLTLGRAKTFFKNYSNGSSFKSWFVETFFPFIINNERLTVNISFNNEEEIIIKKTISKLRLNLNRLKSNSLKTAHHLLSYGC